MRNFFRKSSKVTAETARRVTGIRTPVFGVSWSDPGPSETEIVRRFLVFLEDRRVLYNPFDMETEAEVGHSIHQIREEGTKTLQALSADAFAVVPLRAIREAGDGSMMSSTRIIATSIISGAEAMPVRASCGVGSVPGNRRAPSGGAGRLLRDRCRRPSGVHHADPWGGITVGDE